MSSVEPLWIKGLLSEEYWLDLDDPHGWWYAHVRWDGCVDIYRAANIPFSSDYGLAGEKRDKAACDSYLHICDVDDLIKRLQELKQHAKTHYTTEWPNG